MNEWEQEREFPDSQKINDARFHTDSQAKKLLQEGGVIWSDKLKQGVQINR